MDAEHVCQFVGFIHVPKATSTPPTQASLAHVVFNVTLVEFVYASLLFIVNVHHVGATLSYTYVHVAQVVIFHAISEILNLTLMSAAGASPATEQ